MSRCAGRRFWSALRSARPAAFRRLPDLDGISFGPARPRDMQSHRELNLDEPVRNWEAGEDISGDRAMLVAKGAGDTRYFVSADLPDGAIGWEAGGNLDRPLDFASTFDALMSHGFHLQRDRPSEPAAPSTADESGQETGPVGVARAVPWSRGLTEDARGTAFRNSSPTCSTRWAVSCACVRRMA